MYLFKDPRHKKINFSEFGPKNKEPKALYGLPNKVEFCSTCVVSNQRPNSSIEYLTDAKKEKKSTIAFNKDNICDACKVSLLKEKVDWKIRRKELEKLCDQHRSNNGDYDCIVPGSGGKDSFYASWMLKYEFGMHPLTITWAPNLYTTWGKDNFYNWIDSGFDNQLYTPNIKTQRLLTRLAVENLFHPFQAFIIGQKMLAPNLSKQLNIPLVFYGESEAEYGNPQSEVLKPVRTENFHAVKQQQDIYLGGMKLENICDTFSLPRSDFKMFIPQNNDAPDCTEIHYLGYYLKWHPQDVYYKVASVSNFKNAQQRNPGSYLMYDSIDDKIDDLHYYTTFIKFGIGRAVQDAAHQVRNKDITRAEGINLIKKFDGEFSCRFIPELMEYLSLPEKEFPGVKGVFEQPIMDEEYFRALSNNFRSPHLWEYKNDDWSLRKAIWHEK